MTMTTPITIRILPISMILTTILIIMLIISEHLLLATSRLQTGSLPAASAATTATAGTASSAAGQERWGRWNMIRKDSQVAHPFGVDHQPHPFTNLKDWFCFMSPTAGRRFPMAFQAIEAWQ